MAGRVTKAARVAALAAAKAAKDEAFGCTRALDTTPGAVVFCRPHESLRREQLERAGVAAAPPTAGGKRCFGDMFTGEDCTLGMSGGPRTASFPSPLPLDDPDYVRGAAVYCSTHGGSPGHAINEVIFEAVLAVARQKGREWLSRGLVLLPQKRVCDKYYIDMVIANPLVAHRVAEETDEGPHLVGSAPAEVRCVLRALDGGPPPPFSAPQARPSPATPPPSPTPPLPSRLSSSPLSSSPCPPPPPPLPCH